MAKSCVFCNQWYICSNKEQFPNIFSVLDPSSSELWNDFPNRRAEAIKIAHSSADRQAPSLLWRGPETADCEIPTTAGGARWRAKFYRAGSHQPSARAVSGTIFTQFLVVDLIKPLHRLRNGPRAHQSTQMTYSSAIFIINTLLCPFITAIGYIKVTLQVHG